MKKPVLCALLMLTASLPYAAKAEAVAQITAGDTLIRADGQTVHLRGIWPMDKDAAQKALSDMAAGKDIALHDAAPDRYGRTEADVSITDGKQTLWPADELVRQGLAFAYLPSGNEPRMAELIKAEAEARSAQRGAWAKPGNPFADIDAAEAEKDPDKVYGRYAFIRGTVADSAKVRNVIYLNFGADYRRDVTAAIPSPAARAFKTAGIDILDYYKGKMLRIRGWVKRKGGPMITITHPGEIEVLAGK